MEEKKIVERIQKLMLKHDVISQDIIEKKNIKLGLRNSDGSGVIVGITAKGACYGYEHSENGAARPADGRLFYAGYPIEGIIDGLDAEKRFGYEETVFLLMTGVLPAAEDLKLFCRELYKRRKLTKAERSIFNHDAENYNQIYMLHSALSHLGRCDAAADSSGPQDVIRQSLNVIAKLPAMVALGYNFYRFKKTGNLVVVRHNDEISMAENFLYMINGVKPDSYDAMLLDRLFILHAEHGGGNNSTFSVRTVVSSGANTYMALSAGVASISGYLHSGSDQAVIAMMCEMKKKLKGKTDSERSISSYLKAVLDGKEGEGSPKKIYGFGHSVYTVSDPRSVILKRYAKDCAEKKGRSEEFAFFALVEEIASRLLGERQGRPVCANVDFYSALLYHLLNIPEDLYASIFVMSRMAGWSAHGMEQRQEGKIIRPAYIMPDNNIKKL